MSTSLVTWLKSTTLSQMMVEQPWLWPTCETLHFVGLVLVIGIAGLFDLRLLGFMKQVPVAAVMQLRPWAAVGVAINVVTGVMFLVGAPDQYLNNSAWWAKVFFLFVAVINIAVFETKQGARMLTMPPGMKMPASFKVAGAVSIVSWLAVLYFGRMLAFIGNAF